MGKLMSQALIAAMNPAAYASRAARLKVVYSYNGAKCRIVNDTTLRVTVTPELAEEARDTMVFAGFVRKFYIAIGNYDGKGFTVRITGVR